MSLILIFPFGGGVGMWGRFYPPASATSAVANTRLTRGVFVFTLHVMTPLRPANFRVDEGILDALRRIRERDGVPVSEQLRRALLAWIESKGESVDGEKKARKRAK